jgi:hypothetical protein
MISANVVPGRIGMPGRAGASILTVGEGFLRALDTDLVVDVGWIVGGPVLPRPTLRRGGGGACLVSFGLGVVGIGGEIGNVMPGGGGVLFPSEYEIVGECG